MFHTPTTSHTVTLSLQVGAVERSYAREVDPQTKVLGENVYATTSAPWGHKFVAYVGPRVIWADTLESMATNVAHHQGELAKRGRSHYGR